MQLNKEPIFQPQEIAELDNFGHVVLTLETRIGERHHGTCFFVVYVCLFLSLKTVSHITRAKLELTLQLRITLNFLFSCIQLPHAWIIGI